MNFAEAMQAVWEGKKVRSIEWVADEHIHLHDGVIVDEDNEPVYHFSLTESSMHTFEIYGDNSEAHALYVELIKGLRDLTTLACRIKDL